MMILVTPSHGKQLATPTYMTYSNKQGLTDIFQPYDPSTNELYVLVQLADVIRALLAHL